MEGWEFITTIALVIVFATIGLNILQLWCLHRHFRRHVNPLMVIIFHLSVADLVQGISFMPITIFKVLERKLFVGSYLIHECIDVCKQLGKYLASVSIVTLATLTVLKMLRVTRNEWLTKSTIKRICRTKWSVVFVCFFTEYVVYKAHRYSDDAELVKKYRRFWLPVLAFPATIIFVFSFSKMFYVLRTRMMHTSNEPDNRSRQFLTIAILNLLGFIVCAVPLAVLDVVDLVIHIHPDPFTKLEPIFKYFLIVNPLVDTIGFLIVYRRKSRRRRRPCNRNMELRRVHKRSAERWREFQVDDNHVSSAHKGASGTALAVVCSSDV